MTTWFKHLIVLGDFYFGADVYASNRVGRGKFCYSDHPRFCIRDLERNHLYPCVLPMRRGTGETDEIRDETQAPTSKAWYPSPRGALGAVYSVRGVAANPNFNNYAIIRF